MQTYVHGYSEEESKRLADQANTLAGLLHHDSLFPAGARVLEAGCGTGEQTVILANNNPETYIVSVDLSLDSIVKAKTRVTQEAISNVTFEIADIFNLPFKPESFDHVFVCFVLEHLRNPLAALGKLHEVLRKGGSITVIEGDHGSFYCHPESKEASLAVQCLIDLQASLGGNSLIGRQVYPLLKKANFGNVEVTPRLVYVDSSKPALVEGFTKKTFTAMVEGVREHALSSNMIDERTWNKGIEDLYRAAEDDGTFCYTFFKGKGWKER